MDAGLQLDPWLQTREQSRSVRCSASSVDRVAVDPGRLPAVRVQLQQAATIYWAFLMPPAGFEPATLD
jgi:hypothetical protein